jgi:hypothetical protein
MRRRKQERPRTVIQELDQRLRACDVPAERADRFRKRADLHVDAPVKAEVIDGSPPVVPKYAAGVRVVTIMMHPNSSATRRAGKRAEVAIHAEHAVGDDEREPIARQRRDDRPRGPASRCGNTLMLARLRRAPSMMLAWFSSSDTMKSSLPRIDDTVPAFAAKPL